MSLQDKRVLTNSLNMRAGLLLNLADGKRQISDEYPKIEISEKQRKKLIEISKDLYTLAYNNAMEMLEEELSK